VTVIDIVEKCFMLKKNLPGLSLAGLQAVTGRGFIPMGLWPI
jgi:hypothetical protein